MKKKILAITLALCLVFAMTSLAFAGNVDSSSGAGNTNVNLTVSAGGEGGSGGEGGGSGTGGGGAVASIDVSVPENITITAQAGTVVATVGAYTITNNADIGQVKLVSLELNAETGWTKEAYVENTFKDYAAGTKKFAMQAKVSGDTYTDLNSKWDNINAAILHNASQTVELQALIPAQSQAITSEKIATLVATISL